MKVDTQACLHFFTTATTALAAVLPQAYHDVTDVTTKPKRNTQYDEIASSTATPTSTTIAATANRSIMDTPVRNTKQVLLTNKKDNSFPDATTKQEDTTDDADIGILGYRIDEYLPSYDDTYHNHRIHEALQGGSSEHRRLDTFLCPAGPGVSCPFEANVPFSLVSGDALRCFVRYYCRDFIADDFAFGSTISCEIYRACFNFDATGAGTFSCVAYQSCADAQITLENEGSLRCAAGRACNNAMVDDFADGSTISCSGLRSCAGFDAVGAGTLYCSGSSSCADATITLENGGTVSCSGIDSCERATITLENEGTLLSCGTLRSCIFARITLADKAAMSCSYRQTCSDATITLGGSSLVECRTAQSCGIDIDSNVRPATFIASSAEGTILCKAGYSCFASFDLRDNTFLLICEDSFSCVSTSVQGTKGTCVVCAQENSCARLDDQLFVAGTNKTRIQLSGTCSYPQIDDACALIEPTRASSLYFCATSQPSFSPSESSNPSLLPSEPPSESSHPSIFPSGVPTESSHPSIFPSKIPSESSQPSLFPSEPPSESSHPSILPSGTPSESSYPSIFPSGPPTESSHPSILPSGTPSESSHPSFFPSEPPSESSHPSIFPSGTPSESFHPSLSPSKKPAIGKKAGGKPVSGMNGGTGSKKEKYNGGKKQHQKTWSTKKKISKVENTVMREP